MLGVLSLVGLIAKPLAMLMVDATVRLCCRECRRQDKANRRKACLPRRLRKALAHRAAALGRVGDFERECAICLGDLATERDDFEVVIRDCQHKVHLQCMERWIERNDTCPVCPGSVEQLIMRRPRRARK